MANCLFACDLGEGLGHVRRLVAIARHLGNQVITLAAATQLQRSEANRLLGGQARIIAGPNPIAASAKQSDGIDCVRQGMSLADALHRSGFADRPAVAANVEAWSRLVDDVQPDLVVSDFAPAIRVALGSSCKHLVVGSGFTIPPRSSPLPTYDHGARHSDESLRHEAEVLNCLNDLRAELALPAFGCLADVLYGDATFVASLPCLDPYRDLRQEASLRPFNLLGIAPGPPFADRSGPDIFGYLDANYSGINAVLTALNGLGRRTELFIRDLDPVEVARHCAPHIGVHQHPPDPGLLLPQTRLVIHHGGLGLATAGLLVGVPQLLLPRQMEQQLNTMALNAIGTSIGIRAGPEADPDAVRGLMIELLENLQLEDRALSMARTLAAQCEPSTEGRIVATCETILAQVHA